ncbi:hypothetical protein [Embleya sp. MST-111070]|uniref:hypothetical protein n=1 Tax=Embleya sp. MST-111070 TaxID=3398231 RepID=UPI003F73DFA4
MSWPAAVADDGFGFGSWPPSFRLRRLAIVPFVSAVVGRTLTAAVSWHVAVADHGFGFGFGSRRPSFRLRRPAIVPLVSTVVGRTLTGRCALACGGWQP